MSLNERPEIQKQFWNSHPPAPRGLSGRKLPEKDKTNFAIQ